MHSNWQCAGALTKPLLYCQVEIKNLNSFSSVSRAIDFEISRQVLLHSQGQGDQITQETRLWEEGAQHVVTSCFYSSDVVETSTRFMVHFVILCLLYVPLANLACVKYFFENSYNEEKGRAF